MDPVRGCLVSVHAEILGDRSEESVDTMVAGGVRFCGHKESEGVTVVVGSAQKLEHESKPPRLVVWVEGGDVSSDIGDSVQRLVRLDVECQPRAGGCTEAGEHGNGWLPCTRFVGGDGGLGGAREFCEPRLREPGLCPRST